MRLTEKDEARFWSKVALPNEQGCMLWLAYVRPKSGYADFSIAGCNVLAHRAAYTLAYGPIPEGLVIDHVKARGCTNRHCVAPLHLEAVTSGENVRRGDSGKHREGLTHCVNEHPYTEANTYVRPDTSTRECRICREARRQAHRQRQRAA